MARVVGILKNASAPVLTPGGKPSEARAVDPQDTVVESDELGGKVQVRESVRRYCKALAAKKLAEKEAEEHAAVLRAYVGELRRRNALQGDYQKTYRVVGERADKLVYQVDVSEFDSWRPLKGVDLKELRALDREAFDDVAEEETTISIKDEVLKNKALRLELSRKLEEALGVDGIKKFFKKETTYVVREGMDARHHTLPKAQAAVLEKGFKQVADSVKDATVAAE